MHILQRRKKQGFTLSELMAVVVILAILAALGLGSYRSIMEKTIFNEGVSVGHTIAAAIDEYYYEYHKKPTSLANLPLDLKGVTLSTDGGENKHFTIRWPLYGEKIVLVSKSYPYQLWVYIESNEKSKSESDKCVGTIAEGKEFCQSLGYITCTGFVCTK